VVAFFKFSMSGDQADKIACSQQGILSEIVRQVALTVFFAVSWLRILGKQRGTRFSKLVNGHYDGAI